MFSPNMLQLPFQPEPHQGPWQWDSQQLFLGRWGRQGQEGEMFVQQNLNMCWNRKLWAGFKTFSFYSHGICSAAGSGMMTENTTRHEKTTPYRNRSIGYLGLWFRPNDDGSWSVIWWWCCSQCVPVILCLCNPCWKWWEWLDWEKCNGHAVTAWIHHLESR